ncbi:MAG: Npun_F5560 family protein [Pseudanabaenaceae cyanobacterium]|jgi:chromosome segregation ATPase
MNTIAALQDEIEQLKQELEQRDLLVQQLSEELFRLVKGNTAFMPNAEQSSPADAAAIRDLQDKLTAVEAQLSLSENMLQQRDQEIFSLRQNVQELTDHAKMLEQIVQEMPNVYRAKFAERMVPIKQKVESLQRENRQLHIELQSLSFRIANRHRPPRIELPKTAHQNPVLPMFGAVDPMPPAMATTMSNAMSAV